MTGPSSSASSSKPTRRALLGSAAAACTAGAIPASAQAQDDDPSEPETAWGGFRYCLNTSTIREQTSDIVEQIQIASEAGYDGIEPWMRNLSAYVDAGGSIPDLRSRIEDAGLTVESAIGFAQWIVDDDAARAKGLEEAKRDMDLLAQLGGIRIAAPPVGAQKHDDATPMVDLWDAAERYRALLEVGDECGVVPQVEVWGFSKNLSRLGESMFVALEAGHPKACLLGDSYHIYKGGSSYEGLRLLGPGALQVFHINDCPTVKSREELADSDRVYPGDGDLPLAQLYHTFRDVGAEVVLSLELFNKDYWTQDALEVAKTGLEKTKASVAAAFA